MIGRGRAWFASLLVACAACNARSSTSTSHADAGADIGSEDACALPGTGCVADSHVACHGGAIGYSCPACARPEAEDGDLTCTGPTAGTDGLDDYCCVSEGGPTGTFCEADDAGVCPDGYGYRCWPQDDPATLDPSLTCGAPVPDPDGFDVDYCCTY